MTRAVNVSTDLASCLHVFVRHAAVRRLLQPLDDGPYKALHRGDKMFTIDRRGRQETVSIDRVKKNGPHGFPFRRHHTPFQAPGCAYRHAEQISTTQQQAAHEQWTAL